MRCRGPGPSGSWIEEFQRSRDIHNTGEKAWGSSLGGLERKDWIPKRTQIRTGPISSDPELSVAHQSGMPENPSTPDHTVFGV